MYPLPLQRWQPTGRNGCQLPSKSSSRKPACSRASSSNSSGCLQVHSLRASRWAVIMITDEAMLNGATPMFIIRVSVVGASFVCSVDNTM